MGSGFIAQQGSLVHISANYQCSLPNNMKRSASEPLCRNSFPENESKTITLYASPNPAHTEITVHSDIPLETISLFDLNGRLLIQTDEQQLNISHLPIGIYIVQAVTVEGQMLQSKIIHE